MLEMRHQTRTVCWYINIKLTHCPKINPCQNTYNEIGQLKTKKVGNNIQELNYSYNIRGWMTGINLDGSGNFQTGKLFNYKINYNTPLQGLANPNPDFSTAIKPRYNGNIAEVLWQKDGDTHLNRYGYVYDGLNRLLAGLYQSDLTQTSKEHSERLTYDQNGNIITLKRSAYFIGTTADLIDNLTYNYTNTGNKVNAITDATQDSNGYEGGGATIAYDANGNMITMPDKGISSISYNFLNLPFDLQITPDSNTNTAISYLYRADGTKLRKKNTTSETGIHSTTTEIHTTDYLDGFVYLASERSGEISIDSESKVAMEREAFSPESLAIVAPPGGGTSNAVLQFVPTAEGFYDFKENKYIYQYKDHLGNTRVSYAWNTTTNSIDVLDKNDYYPFGMNHLNSNAGSFVGQGSYKNYKYNGKELQESGMYDYGARFYMPDIGRWGTIDDLSELQFPNSPYSYAYNNPIFFNDPTGMIGEGFGDQEDPKKKKEDPIKTTNIQEVVITKYRAIKSKATEIISNINIDETLRLIAPISPNTPQQNAINDARYGKCGHNDIGCDFQKMWAQMKDVPGDFLNGLKTIGEGDDAEEMVIATAVLLVNMKKGKMGNVAKMGSNFKGINAIKKLIDTGKSPKTIIRVDKGKIFGELDHIHFKDGSALNVDGTWKHGSKTLTNAETKFLQSNGWQLPK